MASHHGGLIALTTLSAVLALRPTAAGAQGVLAGRVVGDGKPVANAEILVDSLRARTTDDGRYVLRVPAGDRRQVAVRAVGFQPAVAFVAIASGDTTVADFALTAVVQVLDSVTVKAAGVATSPKMIGFEERRKQGFGHFITRDELATQEHSLTSTVMRRSNAKLIQLPAACGGGYAIATGRGGAMNAAAIPCGRIGSVRTPPGCFAPIYLDGVAIWGPGWGPPPNVDQFRVVDLEGVEVYRSWVEAPLQYQTFRSPCGVVLLWTRTGHR